MRISDWSSDVCSSDLSESRDVLAHQIAAHHAIGQPRLVGLIDHLPVSRKIGLTALQDLAKREFFLDSATLRLPDVQARVGDRKSVVSGKNVSVRVDPGGRRLLKKQQTQNNRTTRH